MATDERIQVFLTSPLDVFHAVEHRHEIWREDPFDIDTIHPEARAEFRRLLSIATTPPGQERGRILLLRGNAGAGKTHLLRAFRNEVHSTRAGLVGYMPMTSHSTFTRYILSNLVDSLDQPYDEASDTRSGLVRLAGILASRAFQPQLANHLRDEPDLSFEEIAELTMVGAEKLLAQGQRYEAAGIHLLQALLLLHRPDPRIKTRVLPWLRCEDLTEADQKVIGSLRPMLTEEAPQQMIAKLGKLIWAVGNMALVICLDQLEAVWNADASKSAVRAIQTICDLAEDVPSSIFVVCCLDDVYIAIRSSLASSYVDRIEDDPKPSVLREKLSREQAEDMVAARLRHLYATANVAPASSDRLFPFTEPFFVQHANLATRVILKRCRDYRDACRAANRLVDPISTERVAEPLPTGPDEEQQAIMAWEQQWSDELALAKVVPPDSDDDEGLMKLLTWALETAGEELESGWRFSARLLGSMLAFDTLREARVHGKAWVAVCNKTPRFGWLARQIKGYTEEAAGFPDRRRLVLLRSSEFSKAEAVNKAITDVIKKGGETVVVPHGDWRTMLTFKRFQEDHGKEPHFETWAKQENHLSQLPSIRAILEIDRLESEIPPPPQTPKVDPRPGASSQPAAQDANAGSAGPPADQISLGTTKAIAPQTVLLTLPELTRHAAFLGGSGSGKTTLALNVVEQLLARKIPVILLDRKGDLAGYARQSVWSRPHSEPVLDARRKALHDSVDVALFTPGHPHGRPLSIALAPDGLADMEEVDREEASSCAAAALADMLGYRTTSKDKTLRAILLQAFQVLGSLKRDGRIDLQSVVDLVDSEDPALVSAVGRLDTKLFRQVVQDVETLKISTTQLFSTAGERLDVDLLLGTGAFARADRTRLSIISTKFLRDESQVLFWVAQLLLTISRWSAKNPKDRLQAVVMFDEADMYLPAMRQPATKAPMENLLKRSRSAGLGVLLATQSPGDLDYRCRDNVRTWFLGRIKEPTALMKLKPMVEGAPGDVLSKLPGQDTGDFCVVGEKKVTPFRAARSVLDTEQIPDEELVSLARETLNRSP